MNGFYGDSMKNVPILLVCDEMLSSIDEQLMELEKYKTATTANFLYSYALFEGLIRELSFQLYYAFPVKLKGFCEETKNENKYCEIENDKLLMTNSYYFVLNSIIDRKLYKISKDSITNFLKTFIKHSGITLKLNESLLSDMTKARNIIAHSNAYKVKPWNIDSAMFSYTLKQSNLQKYINYISEFCICLKCELGNQFQKYTYEKLLLESWHYTCPKKLSLYDVFDFSSGEAKVKVESAIENISKLSVDEKYIVSIWLENYNLNDMYYIMSKVGEVYSSAHISMNNEIRYLQQLFREYPYLVNGQQFGVENGLIKA